MANKIGVFLIVCATAGGGSTVWAHGSENHKQVCMKDGKVIKVKGKTIEDKKTSCLKKGGDWVTED